MPHGAARPAAASTFVAERGCQAPHYRLYKLSSLGHFVSGDWIEAEDDARAIEAAHALCDLETTTIEVWQRDRQVAIVPCATGDQATARPDGA